MSQEAAREQDDLRPEYDFSAGVRGKHFEAYRKGTNVVCVQGLRCGQYRSPPSSQPRSRAGAHQMTCLTPTYA